MDEYLKIVLEQIRCKKARPYIRQELRIISKIRLKQIYLLD